MPPAAVYMDDESHEDVEGRRRKDDQVRKRDGSSTKAILAKAEIEQ